MNEQYLIIYNPISGKGRSKNLLKYVTRDFDAQNKKYKIKKTNYPGHAIKICQDISQHKKLIVIGGDGTFHEALNGLMTNQHDTIPIIGFIPGGTGNALMHDLLATTYKEAIDIILNENTKKIDILKLDFFNKIKYSINIVGWGMVADINVLAEKLRILGSSRYTIASIYYVFNKHPRKAKIIIDGHEREGEFLFILSLNTIHTGKGMRAAPKALLDDGLLDIIILKAKISRWQLLQLLPKIFTGEHILSDKIDYIQAKTIEIHPQIQEKLNIDGEMKCRTPISISVLPKKLNIFYRD